VAVTPPAPAPPPVPVEAGTGGTALAETHVEPRIDRFVDRLDAPAIAVPGRVEVRIGTLEIVAPTAPASSERRVPSPAEALRPQGRSGRRTVARGFDDLFLARAHLNR